MSDKEADVIRDRLAKLYKKHGTITPDIIIEDAKDEQSPLHAQFEWDTDVAAMEHWREQARAIIRTVRFEIVVENITIRPPQYIRDPSAAPGVQAYIAVDKLKRDKVLAVEALQYEMDRAEGALERAREIGIALGLEKDFSRLMAQFGKVKQKADKAA